MATCVVMDVSVPLDTLTLEGSAFFKCLLGYKLILHRLFILRIPGQNCPAEQSGFEHGSVVVNNMLACFAMSSSTSQVYMIKE